VIGLYQTDCTNDGGWRRKRKAVNWNTNLIFIIFQWFKLIFDGVGHMPT
jgi:hypothetical protein